MRGGHDALQLCPAKALLELQQDDVPQDIAERQAGISQHIQKATFLLNHLRCNRSASKAASGEIRMIVVDLPFPPSVNKIWRAGSALSKQKVHLAPSYQKWKSEADALLMSTKGWLSKRIRGRFTAEIIVCAPTSNHQRGDLDNRVKAIFDFLQRVEIIDNDKNCQKFSVEWGNPDTAPTGCRVTITPIPLQSMEEVLHRAEARASQ